METEPKKPAAIPTTLRRGDIAIVRIGDAAVKVMVQ